MEKKIYLIIGLGNPGEKYAHTRHNAGFDVLDILSQRHDCLIRKNQCRALTGEYFSGGEKILLACPQTFMNNSGECVIELVDYYKIPLDHLLVVYDDIDLETGRRFVGGAMGQDHSKTLRIVSAKIEKNSIFVKQKRI